jgi:hypothetical protein
VLKLDKSRMRTPPLRSPRNIRSAASLGMTTYVRCRWRIRPTLVSTTGSRHGAGWLIPRPRLRP